MKQYVVDDGNLGCLKVERKSQLWRSKRGDGDVGEGSQRLAETLLPP